MGVVYLDTVALLGYLEAHEVSLYRLAQEVEKLGASRATAYAVATGKSNPSFETLGKIIQASRTLTGDDIQVGDIVRYSEKPTQEVRP